jgi:ubiquinone/menaquinone biosynthesis C-methylase UbiE
MGYTRFDRFVARRRFRAALPHLKARSIVCDVGCGLDAGFLSYAGSHIARGVGLDYQVRSCPKGASIICANIADKLPLSDSYFDHVVMLAVLEHLREPKPVLCELFRILRPCGSLVLTWPHGLVDPFLTLFHRAGLVSKEMESQEHQRRIPLETLIKVLSDIGFRNFFHQRFELGLNNLLVASKPE